MGRSSRFHPNPKAWKAAEELRQILPAQLSLQRRLLFIVNAMQLKNTFRRVDTNARKLPHGRLPCLRICNDLNLAHSMPSGPSTPTFSSFPVRHNA
jgi:hypothetical protein